MAAVELVLRDKVAFAGLPHVVALSSEFLDCSVELTLAAACKVGSWKLLGRIWNSCRETRVEVDSSGAWQSLLEAVKKGDDYGGVCTDCDVPVIVVEKTAELGKLRLLKFCSPRCGFAAAAGRANLSGGGRHRVHWGGRDAEKTARNGHSNVAWWLLVHASTQRDIGNIMSAAGSSGDVPLMGWLMCNEFNRHLRDRPQTLVKLVKWMYNHGFTGNDDLALMDAASINDLEMVSRLLDHRIGLDSYGAFNTVITNHSLNTAKYMDEHSDIMEVGRYFEETMTIAVHRGELEAVQWMVAEFADDPDIDLFEPVTVCDDEPSTVLDAAVENGNLEIVRYLHKLEQDKRKSKRKRRKQGKARRKGGTWRGRGVTCTPAAMDIAAKDGNLEILQWLHRNRSEGCTTDAMDFAAGGGDPETIQWLHGNRKEGCTVEAMNYTAGKECLGVVKWLHEHRSEGCTTKAIDTAAKKGHLNVVKWLSKERNEGCTTNAMDAAASNGHLKWLHYHRSVGYHGGN
ncbi:hypothetical protein ON010_g9206 [Phytophthora cinnamomi]|nr:hypothetical protein ON010_g9206 [Phytophthora cinnamomi]